jgi:gp16 family phage-associated protein
MPAVKSSASLAIPATDDRPHLGQEFRELGQSIAAWAKHHNFNPRLVYAVMRGERKCVRGQSYQIAKELGMK